MICPRWAVVQNGGLTEGSCADIGYTVQWQLLPQTAGPCGTLTFDLYNQSTVSAPSPHSPSPSLPLPSAPPLSPASAAPPAPPVPPGAPTSPAPPVPRAPIKSSVPPAPPAQPPATPDFDSTVVFAAVTASAVIGLCAVACLLLVWRRGRRVAPWVLQRKHFFFSGGTQGVRLTPTQACVVDAHVVEADDGVANSGRN